MQTEVPYEFYSYRVLMLERCTLVRLSVYVLTYCCGHVLVGLVDACLIQLL